MGAKSHERMWWETQHVAGQLVTRETRCPATYAIVIEGGEEHWRCKQIGILPLDRYVLAVSRGIKQRHFLPRKPGVFAYAGEQVVCMFTVMNILHICFLISNCL